MGIPTDVATSEQGPAASASKALPRMIVFVALLCSGLAIVFCWSWMADQQAPQQDFWLGYVWTVAAIQIAVAISAAVANFKSHLTLAVSALLLATVGNVVALLAWYVLSVVL